MKFFIASLFLLFFAVTPAFAQLDFYRVPSQQIYPEVYIPQKILYVNSLDEMKKNLLKNPNTPVAYVFNTQQPQADLRNYHLKALPSLTVRKINNSRYILTIDNMTGDIVLVFNQKYHAAWDISTNNDDVKCGLPMTVYKKFNVYVCNALNMNYNIIDGLEGLAQKKQIKAEHFSVNDLSNAWLIHSTSPHMDILMEFEIQNYFYIGFIVSFLATCFCIGYLITHLKK